MADQSNEMVERVAKAMEARRLSLIGQPLNRVYDELAKAAIEAMRPTPALLTEMTERLLAGEHAGKSLNERALNCYIDAALSHDEVKAAG